jgi:hypothetical protein
MGDDFKLEHWRKDMVGSSGNTGKCAAVGSAADQLLKGDGVNWVGGRTNMYDNYVCGSGHCIGATEAEWKNIYKGCLGDASGTGLVLGRGANARNTKDLYKYPCANMVTDANLSADGGAGIGFNMGWMKLCSKGNIYNEAVGTGTCSKDCDGLGVVHDALSWGGDALDGGTMDAGCGGEYGTNYPSLGYWNEYGHTHAIPKNIQGVKDLPGTWNTDKNVATSCPTTHSRGFQCAGDGYPAPMESGMPGCFQGDDISGLEGPLRFCARGSEHYETVNLMNCCLGEKGDPSTAGEHGHQECPVGYCRTSISQTDIADDNPCIEGKGTDLTCYEMTDKCNTMFEELCTAELFNDDDDLKLGKQAQCRKWATIQPTQFNNFASGICSINSRLGVTEEISLIEALQSTSNKKNLTDLFNSELCREYLLTSSEIQPQLEEICSLAVELKEDGSWVKTGFGEDIGRLCECYFPDAYYQWYKTDSGILTEDEVASAVDKVRPECFHMGCARSGNYSVTENAECPDVYKCIQTINNNTPIVDVTDRFGAVARPSASEQNCNFNIINPAGGATLPVQQGGGSGSSSGSGSGSGSSPDIPFNDNLGSGSGYDDDGDASSDSGAFGRDTRGGTSSTGDDNMMILLAGGVFCCSILVMIMMTMSGGGGGRGRGMSYGQPMPYGMY